MRGFAVIDLQPDDAQIAVWIVSKSEPAGAGNSNAVVLGRGVPEVPSAVRSLTRLQAVVVTEGSTVDGLPVDGAPLTTKDLQDLLEETSHVREEVLRVARFLRRKPPAFLPLPNPGFFRISDDTAAQRALQTANFLGRAWSAWLDTDQHRRRYRADSKVKAAGLLSADLDDAEPMILPPGFQSRVIAQPLV